MAQTDIGIDLGTTTIIIAQAGQGVVLNQPSVVAVDTRKNSVLEVGDKALAMVGRTPNYISAIFPLKDGVISDHTMTRELICRFVNQVYSSHMVKPRVAVCVPAAITGIESDAVVEAVMAAGARQVYLIDEPIAAALGSGIDITQPDGRMIIDIGGGTTEVAVIAMGGIVVSQSIRIAGDEFDQAILTHVRDAYNLAIGERTAEDIKIKVGSAVPLKDELDVEVNGRDVITGLPKTVRIESEEIRRALNKPLDEMAKAVKDALDATPPDLASDLMYYGILLTGGGALLRGLDVRLRDETGVSVNVSPTALDNVVNGCARVLEANAFDGGFVQTNA